MEACTYVWLLHKYYVVIEKSSTESIERKEETEVDNQQSSVIKKSDTRDPPNIAVPVRKQRKW